MRILAAELTDFRNIVSADLRFSPYLTALVGPNGQGKTNLLEALYTVAALRPLRNVPRTELIREGAKKATLKLGITSEHTGLDHQLELQLLRTTRHTIKDGKRCETRSFLGHLVAVAFTPDDLALTKGGPDGRRRFLDRAILNTRPGYLDLALRYAQAVRSRNKVLAEEGPDELLTAYETVLAKDGTRILLARRAYIEAIAGRVSSGFQRIADPAPALELVYEHSLAEALQPSDPEATEQAFLELLLRRRKHDRYRKSTSVGPHRDDLDFRFGGTSARSRASQGQHRAMVLALKLAEISHLSSVLGEPPVLLLDDISSELDAVRSRQLFEAMAELEGQVILTTTDEGQVPAGLGDGAVRRYDVSGGVITERSNA